MDAYGEDFKMGEDMINYCNNYFITIAKKIEAKIPMPEQLYTIKRSQPVSMFLASFLQKIVVKVSGNIIEPYAYRQQFFKRLPKY